MATTIKLKNSVTTTNTPTSLAQGEVAINITDKKVWVGNAATTPIQLLGAGGSASFGALTCTSLTNSGLTSGRVTYATTAGLLTDSANLTFNGTTLTAAALTSTGVATFSAGTVSAPAITTTGDTNTGIFFPAADTIAFTEGGVESMRIDSSGNVGIGTTSIESFGGGYKTLEVAGSTNTEGGVFKTATSGSAGSGSTGTEMLMYTDSVGGKINVVSAHPAVFYTANTERMRIDSSGNVGIGTSSPTRRLQVYQTTGDYQARLGFSDSYYYDFGRNSTNGYFNFYGNQSGATGYIWGGVDGERMRIDSSGNVGIGTNGPAAKLDVRGSSTFLVNATNPTAWISVDSALTTGSMYNQWNTTSSIGITGTYTNHPYALYTNNTERMRITSGGDFCVGTTGFTGAAGFSVAPNYSNGSATAVFNRADTANTSYAFYFQNNATTVGSISYTNTATAYTTSSDYRLKENIAPMTGALGVVQQLKPCTYTWKADGSAGQGFIAHELQVVLPDAVTGEKDAVDEKGKPIYQGVDTSFLVATLTAAIQEQQAMIEELKQEVALLKSK